MNGCEYCYARKLANGRLRSRYLANTNLPPDARVSAKLSFREGTAELGGAYSDPFYPRFWEDRLGDIPLKPPRGIFVCDMGELFGDWLPRDWQDRVFNIIRGNPQHRFYLLTKQPQNLAKFSPFPENCWVGVSATDLDMAYRAVLGLNRIEAKVKYISFEPLLDRIIKWVEDAEYLFKHLDWVIIGAQTKPYKPPKREWVDEILRACTLAKIPVFLKNNLVPMFNAYNEQKFPHSPELWDMKGLIKQEMPNA